MGCWNRPCGGCSVVLAHVGGVGGGRIVTPKVAEAPTAAVTGPSTAAGTILASATPAIYGGHAAVTARRAAVLRVAAVVGAAPAAR